MARTRTGRTRPRLSAAERGYHYRHRKLVTAARAAWRPGQPCARCGQPIWQLSRVLPNGKTESLVDLGHVDGSGKTMYQGLEHRHCSRSAGARMGNRMRGRQRRWQASRQW